MGIEGLGIGKSLQILGSEVLVAGIVEFLICGGFFDSRSKGKLGQRGLAAAQGCFWSCLRHE